MRHQSYTDYENLVLLFVRILGAILRIDSMRKISDKLNRTICIENIGRMLELEEELTEIPHWKTINNFLKKLNPEELELVIHKLTLRLTRMRTFEKCRIRNKYWQVVVDATQLFTFNERHCEHCLVREFKDKKTKEVIRREYYHVVLEAKLVILGNVVISIGTEFIENESPNVTKQDCELNAFKRLAKKLKTRFPRLPICLGMDSLYANGPIFDICKNNKWEYIIRFKDGSIKSVAEEFHSLKGIEPGQNWIKQDGGITKTYQYVLDVLHQSHKINIIECVQSNMEHPFVFVTSLVINKKNGEKLVEDGRRRWKIENEGFNEQKNGGYDIEHMFCKDYKAIKNHYFLIQIGHMISQLLEYGLKKLKEYERETSREIISSVIESLRTDTLNSEDEVLVNRRRQYRILE